MARSFPLPFVLLLTTLSACGGDGATVDASAAPAVPAAAAHTAATTGCRWLTSEVATGLLGAPVTVDVGGQDECSLSSEPNTFSGRIYVDPSPLGNTVDVILSPYENTAGWGARQSISGLGDRAAWVGHAYPTGGYGGVRIAMEQDGRTVTIQLTPATTQEDLPAKAEALVRAIAEQM